MTNQNDFDSEIIGVRPWLMGQILLYIMMVIPLGSAPIEESVDWWQPVVYSVMPYGILWKLESLSLSLNTMWLDPFFLVQALPIIVLSLIFVFEVVRYYKAMVSRKNVIIVGVLSFLMPLAITPLVFGLIPKSGAYFGPLPFLLIVGLIMLYKIPGPEIKKIDFLSELIEQEC